MSSMRSLLSSVAITSTPEPKTEQVPDTKQEPNQNQNITPPEPTEPKSALDLLAGSKFDLWSPVQDKSNLDKDGNPIPDPDILKPEDVFKTVSQQDFRKVIDTETMQKIQSGGEEATTALLTVMNKMVQLSAAQSTLAAQEIALKASKRYSDEAFNKVPSLLKSSKASDLLSNVSNDPVTQPIVNAIKTQLEAKFPAASADQIAGATQELLADWAKKQVAGTVKESKETKVQKTDWADFLASE